MIGMIDRFSRIGAQGLCAIALALPAALQASALDALRDGFAAPPPSARSHVWWHWMNGNVTKDGITADLEAMARAGIGGAEPIDLACGIPQGDVRFGSAEWFDMIRHAHEEGKRLGVEIVLANCSGWSSSGGPWVAPEDSMKDVVFSERILRGGETLDGAIAPATNSFGFYRDIATFAFPRPPAEAIDPADYAMRSTFKPGDCAAKIVFGRPFPLRGLTLGVEASAAYLDAKVKVEISEDGENFTTAVDWMTLYTARYQVKGGSFYVPVAQGASPASVKAVKIACDMNVASAVPGPAWEGTKTVRTPGAKGLKSSQQRLVAIRPEACSKIPEFEFKTFAMRAKIQGVRYAAGPESAVDVSRIVRLPDGAASWTAPAGGGEWVVLRAGYVSNGRGPHPATPGGKGLEVDKLDKAAVGRFFDGYVGKIADMCGPLSPDRGITTAHIDSYELGGQIWTHGFEKTFMEKNGYDILPYLAVLGGRVVESPEKTDRVLADVRRTVSDLFIENYAGEFRRLCHAKGLKFSLEGYGSCPCDDVRYAVRCDIPQCEFWAGHAGAREKESRIGKTGNARFAASVARVWGRRVVGAEAFTSLSERYERDPYACKAQCDRAFCQGVNRIVYHSCAHQPWRGHGNLPGMTMGNIGSHFETTQTWWEDGGAAFFHYQARCQWMLQEGLAASDVLVFSGDGAENYGLDLARWHDYDLIGENAFGHGRQWDVCGGEAVQASRVENGEIVVPSGAKYKAIAVLPGVAADPASLAALDRLAKDGAAVVPAKDVQKTLLARGIGADVLCLTKKHAADLRWTHRRSGGLEWYFVALPNDEEASVEISFRVKGHVPEVWDAETGETSGAVEWREEKGRTTVALDLPPSGSAFVVFRPAAAGGPRRGAKPAAAGASAETPLAGPWRVEFPVGWYFGNGDRKTVEWPELKDWTSDGDPDVKYFSGTATYSISVPAGAVAAPAPYASLSDAVAAGAKVMLDLGEVKNVATVSVNGRELPVLWKPPFRIDISGALAESRSAADAIAISVRTTNLWPNRLIGDEMLPTDAPYNPRTKRWKGGGLKTIPDRVKRGEPSPAGRHTFTTWRHWTKDDKLLPSGILGPAKISVVAPAAARTDGGNGEVKK